MTANNAATRLIEILPRSAYQQHADPCEDANGKRNPSGGKPCPLNIFSPEGTLQAARQLSPPNGAKGRWRGDLYVPFMMFDLSEENQIHRSTILLI